MNGIDQRQSGQLFLDRRSYYFSRPTLRKMTLTEAQKSTRENYG